VEDKYVLVAVNTPFNNSILTYRISEEFGDWKKGTLVKVPLGRRSEKGCLLGPASEVPEGYKVKEVKERYHPELDLSESSVDICHWIASYYHYPVGQLLFDILPKPLKSPRKLKYIEGLNKPLGFELTAKQKSICKDIVDKVATGGFSALIHGVTGSGKSIIYLNIIQEVLKKNKTILFLLPEINLTPQFLKTFSLHLDVPIYSYHSSMSNSDRYGLWRLVEKDEGPKVIIGVRSSIFLPINNLGLIIVDEEHDTSFKQEDRCCYNARDVALKMGHDRKIGVLLGSATPSTESFYAYKELGRGPYYCLSERPGEAILPKVELLDERSSWEDKFQTYPFQPKSFEEIDRALEKGEQVLIFVNRLGYASYLQCHSCGHIFQCPNCSSNLKYFQSRGRVDCYICGYQDRAPNMCPECTNLNIVQKGYGTEKLHKILEEKYPEKNVGRFDRDLVKTFNQLKEVLSQFSEGKIDILVGTQMLSKGHNFEKVNLVLVFGQDSYLSFPDFRANERVFQQLTQISGRAGRYSPDSKVLIHTLIPEHPLYQLVIDHSFDGFYQDEMSLRDLCQCPPYTNQAALYLTGKLQEKVEKEAYLVADVCRTLIEKKFSACQLLGPKPAMIEKRVNKYTWCLLLKSKDRNQLHNCLHSLMRNHRPDHHAQVKVDIDPYHFH